MRISYTFRNLESSEGMKNYAAEKIGKLQKYLHAPLEAEVTFFFERHLHVADISVSADGHRYAARESSEDMYASIDMAMDKIERQVRDAKAAATQRRRHAASTADLAQQGE